MGSSGAKAGRRTAWSVAAVMLATVVPARAACSLAVPSCWAERIETACATEPTEACVADMRLRLLDRAMTAQPEATRELFHSTSFEIAILARDPATRRAVAALGARHGFQPNAFGTAVKLFAEDRSEWRAPLERGDVAGAIAAIPDPTLSVSYQWLDGTIDTIFREALRRGRADEVLEAIAAGRIDGDNWRSQRDAVFDRWFRLIRRGDPALVERLIGLADPERATSMRLALAATAADPNAIGSAFAQAFPGEPAPIARVDDEIRTVWRAFDALADEPAAVRERFLDAMPRFVGADWPGVGGPSLAGPVGRGDVGVVRRLVARSLPDDEAADVFFLEGSMTAAGIERSLPELDPPDRRAASGLLVEALVAEKRWDRVAKAIASRPVLEALTGADSDGGRLRRIVDGLKAAGRHRTATALLAPLDDDARTALLEEVEMLAQARGLLAILARTEDAATRGYLFDGYDDDALKAASDLASERGDCRDLLLVTRARHPDPSDFGQARDLVRALGWVASCVAKREETRR